MGEAARAPRRPPSITGAPEHQAYLPLQPAPRSHDKKSLPMAIVDTQTMPVQHHISPQLGMKQQHPVACVGLLYCAASNRTFRIPDVPATSSVGHIKQWYSKNVGDGVDLRALVVVHNNLVLEDTVLVWQLAQGQGQFAVTVAENKSPRSMLSLFVESTLPIPAIPLCISSDSTVLYVKQKLFEMLNMPMSLASSSHTTLLMPPSTTALQNCCTLADCGVRNNMCLSLVFQPEAVQPTAPSPFQQQPQYARIQEIWADNVKAPTKPQDVPIQPVPNNQATAATHALLPSLLLEDEEDEESVLSEFIAAPLANSNTHVQVRSNNNTQVHGTQSQHTSNSNSGHKSIRGGRRQRSRSPPGSCSELTQDQLQHLAANFRTKMCRNGPTCKFGRNCWFAHNHDECRKPSDPLPNNLPAVHKLERYSHREATAAKDRQGH